MGTALSTIKLNEFDNTEGVNKLEFGVLEAVTVIPDVVPAGVVPSVEILREILITVELFAGRITGLADHEAVAPLGNEVPVRESVVLPAVAPPVGVIAIL